MSSRSPICAWFLLTILLASAPALPQSKQPTQPLDEIVRHFAEKEGEYAAAHRLYNYQLSIRLQELSEDGETLGEFTQSSEVDLDASGRRRQQLLENPHNDLTKLEVPRIELDELNFIPLFILTPEQIPEYNVTYLTTERLDEVDTYLFHLEPNHPPHANDRLFEGIIWVDARKLDIVRAHGRALPSHPSGALKEYFRRVEVFREPVDGNLFPTYVRADDVLSVRDVPLKARLVVRFRNHQRITTGPTQSSHNAIQRGALVPPDDFSYPEASERIQYETPFRAGSLRGKVVDPSRAVRERVLVEIVDEQWRKRIRAVFSDSDGSFAFNDLPGGEYRVRVSFQGFRTRLFIVITSKESHDDLLIELIPDL